MAKTQQDQEQLVTGTEPGSVADRLADVARRAGADALNLRVQVPGVTPADARNQIVRLGDEVLPRLRQQWRSPGAAGGRA